MEQILDKYLIPSLTEIVIDYLGNPLIANIKLGNNDVFSVGYIDPHGIIDHDWGDGTPIDYQFLNNQDADYPTKLPDDINLEREILVSQHQYSLETEMLDQDGQMLTIYIYGNAEMLIFNSPFLVEVVSYGLFTPKRIIFRQCDSLIKVPNYLPQSVTDTSYMFASSRQFNQHLEYEMTNVTKVIGMFSGCINYDQPVTFDIIKVTDTSFMFLNCISYNKRVNLYSQKLLSTRSMFDGCSEFNSAVIIDTSKVTNMSNMFRNCTKFNQQLYFDTSNVDNFYHMLIGCTSFTKNLNFQIKNSTDTSHVFN